MTLIGALPVWGKRRAWFGATAALILAAVPPAIVVYLAKRAFDQDAKLLM